MFSLIIPVYKNELNIRPLNEALESLAKELKSSLEVVFVIDGSPDQSYQLILKNLPNLHYSAQLIQLSRNFGSFAAIRAGIKAAKGKYFAVMAADLQEPPSLINTFFEELSKEEIDIVVATRLSRNDPKVSRFLASIYWYFYRQFINKEIPRGGVDIFACNERFRSVLLELDESHSSLIGLIFWLGFRRKFVSYERHARVRGTSAWSFSKKFKYLNDSIFSFSDLPIKILMVAGTLGLFFSGTLSLVVLILRISGKITVPGYAATALIISLFGALNTLGIGILGNYVWRVYENTKRRPLSVVMQSDTFSALPAAQNKLS